VVTGIDFSTLVFGDALFLWLLLVPGVLLVLWIVQVVRRRKDAKLYQATRVVPMREKFTWSGDLAFWFCLILATSLTIVALARPQARVTIIRKAGADIVILQDGSASMYVKDVKPDRWRRSIQFLRTFADALSWKGDRVALAIFAHTAAPQLRLTKDPNSFFFFLDHLGDHSPFRLEDTPTWDTNIETGIEWGVKLAEKDAELFGKSKNPKGFVVITDGQDWSGTVATALADARRRKIPVNVVGVGTVGGGMIPSRRARMGRRRPPACMRSSTATTCGRSPRPAAASTSKWATSPTATSRSRSSRASAGAPSPASSRRRKRAAKSCTGSSSSSPASSSVSAHSC
jgi:hypothetical protein